MATRSKVTDIGGDKKARKQRKSDISYTKLPTNDYNGVVDEKSDDDEEEVVWSAVDSNIQMPSEAVQLNDEQHLVSEDDPELLQKRGTFRGKYHAIIRLLLLAILVAQAILLDYYIVLGCNCWYWRPMIALDVGVVVFFIGVLLASYVFAAKSRDLNCEMLGCQFNRWLAPAVWLAYSVVLVVKICVLFQLPESIMIIVTEHSDAFGGDAVIVSIAASSIVLYFLVVSYYDTGTSDEVGYVHTVGACLFFDLMDAAQFLELLLQDDIMTVTVTLSNAEQRTSSVRKLISNLYSASTTAAAVSLMLPTMALMYLSWSGFGGRKASPKYRRVFEVAYILVANIPFFAIRLIVWLRSRRKISVFIIKNAMFLLYAVRRLHGSYEWCIEKLVGETRRTSKTYHELNGISKRAEILDAHLESSRLLDNQDVEENEL